MVDVVSGTATWRIPSDSLGLLGSPAEFTRAERAMGRSLASEHVVAVDGERREVRLYRLPLGTALRRQDRVPGFNIRILPPGTELTVMVREGGDDGQG
jgi:hypothetical protein